MPRAKTNGIELHYETFGAADAQPLVLIMGLGAQMILWDTEFCERLAERGFRVVRFDNRDVGLSTRLKDLPVPNVRRMMVLSALGIRVQSPYSLVDMATDTVGLFDALGIDNAHVVGSSMGGMIAQTIAAHYPRRVRTLTSIMSHTGQFGAVMATPSAVKALMMPRPRTREQAIETYIRTFKVIGSPGFPHDIERMRRLGGECWDRGQSPRGFLRQMAAILAAGNRRREVRTITAPTLVVHGSDDPLIRPLGAQLTARTIRGSHLRIIEGMGHDLPRGAWPEVIDAITDLSHGRLAATEARRPRLRALFARGR
jgi:pimeloyl-ACP methyl ester carboxylesterase